MKSKATWWILFASSSVLLGCSSNIVYSQSLHNVRSMMQGDARVQSRSNTVTELSECGDERAQIIQEYKDYKISFIPGCEDFTKDAHSLHFSFGVLKSRTYPWAIVKGSLLSGLEGIYQAINPLTISSAYRSPAYNATLPRHGKFSRHLFGDAADIASDDDENWEHLKSAGKDAGGCVEPKLRAPDHVHVDWRGKCPKSW